jgi:hypothetical protein
MSGRAFDLTPQTEGTMRRRQLKKIREVRNTSSSIE